VTGYMPVSKTDDWATPQKLYDELNAIYHFDLDPAASSTNHKCDNWYGLDHVDETKRDGLARPWEGSSVWVNPPYGRVLSQWVRKAYEESHDKTVVMLLPCRSDTAWFHDYAIKGNIQFIRGRVKFGDGKSPAPFPSILVIFRKGARRELD